MHLQNLTFQYIFKLMIMELPKYFKNIIYNEPFYVKQMRRWNGNYITSQDAVVGQNLPLVFISITEISVEQDKEVQVFEDKICGVYIH